MDKIPDFTLIRSRRKSVSIEITPQAKIIIRAPIQISIEHIKKFVNEKRDWIENFMAKMQKHKVKQYTEGEEFLYLGNVHKLHIGNYRHIHVDSTLNFPNFLLFRIKKEIASWYMKQAKEIITGRTSHYSKVMQTRYKIITFSDTSSKWGSCTPENNLQFNWRLIMAPLLVIDYVVVHELVHTLEKNHSRKFWSKVELYKPAYRQYRKWLKENSHRLVL